MVSDDARVIVRIADTLQSPLGQSASFSNAEADALVWHGVCSSPRQAKRWGDPKTLAAYAAVPPCTIVGRGCGGEPILHRHGSCTAIGVKGYVPIARFRGSTCEKRHSDPQSNPGPEVRDGLALLLRCPMIERGKRLRSSE